MVFPVLVAIAIFCIGTRPDLTARAREPASLDAGVSERIHRALPEGSGARVRLCGRHDAAGSARVECADIQGDLRFHANRRAQQIGLGVKSPPTVPVDE